MDGKFKFKRTFIIFKQEDLGYGTGQGPSGYIKIEVRDEKGKLYASVQNMKEDPDMFVYKLYIIKCSGTRTVPVCIGTIPIKNNRGEIMWDFNPVNVQSTGYNIGEFEIAAVLVDFIDRKNTSVVCPIAAYKGERIEWRSKIREGLDIVKKNERSIEKKMEEKKVEEKKVEEKKVEEKKIDNKNDVINKSTIDIQSKYIPLQGMPEFNIPDKLRNFEYETEKLVNTGRDIVNPKANCSNAILETPERINTKNIEAEKSDIKNSNVDNNERNNDKNNEQKNQVTHINMQYNLQQAIEEEKSTGSKPSTELNANTQEENICIFKSNGICGIQTDDKNINPCAGCRMFTENMQTKQPADSTGNIDKLKENLDKFFERSDPFNNRRRDYTWWKINSPVYLNNILYQCNIKSSLLFNQALMMAHFKYRHLIFGIYTDKMRRKQYIVCGIPGVYNVDEKPFGSLCRWVQMEGNTPRYGAFGYWLVYIDPRTGKLLNLR